MVIVWVRAQRIFITLTLFLHLEYSIETILISYRLNRNIKNIYKSYYYFASLKSIIGIWN